MVEESQSACKALSWAYDWGQFQSRRYEFLDGFWVMHWQGLGYGYWASVYLSKE
jgi:hypothetical protein